MKQQVMQFEKPNCVFPLTKSNADKHFFGRTLKSALARSTCLSCKGKASKKSFRDDDSYQEYRKDGLCQECQDELTAVVTP